MKQIILSTAVLLFGISNSSFGQKALEKFSYEDISLLDGSLIAEQDLMNKTIIINVWGTWCKYCIKEIPDLNTMVMKYQDRNDVLFLAIASNNSDNLEKINRFLEKRQFLFRQVDPSTLPTFLENPEEIRYSTTIVYNKHGQLEGKFVGVLKKGNFNKIDKIINESGIDR